MPDKLITIAKFSYPIEANLAKNRLQDAGISACLTGEPTNNAFAGMGAFSSLHLDVSDENVAEARRVLHELEEEIEARHIGGLATEAAREEGLSEENPEDPIEVDGLETADHMATRAWRSAVYGWMYFPLTPFIHIYPTSLLIRLVFLGDRLTKEGLRNSLLALLLISPSLAIWGSLIALTVR